MNFIILPGIGNSGDGHWQSHWQIGDASFSRFRPRDWDAPVLGEWLTALDEAIAHVSDPVVLVAHSLSCLLVAHWAAADRRQVAGAFLVGVPDPRTPAFPIAARSFGHVPERALPFPALIVASQDDPYGSLAYARQRASQWQTSLIEAGALGHINAASQLGAWPEGRGLLTAFCAGLGPNAGRADNREDARLKQ